MPRTTRRREPSLHERVRAICLALPEVEERLSHGTPAWFVQGKKGIVWFWESHHSDEYPHLWCAAAMGVQEDLIGADPELFFRPPYVGHRGWLGVRLDREVDWGEVEELVRDAYRVVAPKRLARLLDEPATTS